MEARFFLTTDDVYHYYLFGYKHLRRVRIGALIRLIGLLVILALAFFLPISPSAMVWAFIGLLTVFFVVVYPVAFLLTVLTEPQLQGEHWLLLSPTGLTYRSVQGEQFLPWQQVSAVTQDKYCVYFLLNTYGPLTRTISNNRRVRLYLEKVCIVPKRSFANPLDVGTFVDRATSYRGSAVLAPPATGTAA